MSNTVAYSPDGPWEVVFFHKKSSKLHAFCPLKVIRFLNWHPHCDHPAGCSQRSSDKHLHYAMAR
jgi:hypothetical protein